jgi:hypothetical protein
VDASTERILTAVIDRIIPEDDFPSASQAGGMDFLRRVLAKDEESFVAALNQLLANIDAASRNTVGRPFVDLSAEQQDDVLRTLDNTRAFHHLVVLTNEGYYADPGNGGNRDARSWQMVGYKGEPS